MFQLGENGDRSIILSLTSPLQVLSGHLMFNALILWLFQRDPCPSVDMESRLTSGNMRFQVDNFMKTAIDIHVHRNGEGRISSFPASYSMTKARTPKSPHVIFSFSSKGLFGFYFADSAPFSMVVSKHSKDWPQKIETT